MTDTAQAWGQVIGRLVQNRELSEDETTAIDWVLDAAVEWEEDRLPWWEAANIGAVMVRDWRTGTMIASTGYARFLAVIATPASDPRRAALLKLITVIVEQSGVVITQHGLF